jgi:hypothetical protein
MTLMQARAAMRERLTTLERHHRNYTEYLKDRVAEKDHHGAWGCSINLSETECEMAGIRMCLETLDQVDEPKAPPAPQNPYAQLTTTFSGGFGEAGKVE